MDARGRVAIVGAAAEADAPTSSVPADVRRTSKNLRRDPRAEQFELRYVVPGGQLAVAVVVAAVAGVLAGALLARRAARVDMLRAISVE